MEFEGDVDVNGTSESTSRHLLQPGSYLVEVRERDIDLRVSVDSPSVHAEAEDKVPRHGVIHNVVSLPAAGELRLTLHSVDHRTKKGGAHVRIARWRRNIAAPAGEGELGFTALASADQLTFANTPDTSQRAADKFYEAISHFEAASATAERAQAQYTLAYFLYEARADYAGAIRAADESADAFDSVSDAAGVQNSATIRAASELELASGMDASRQSAEQRAMYEDADRRLRDAAEYFGAHAMPVRAAYAVNMRGIRALDVGEYENAAKLFAQAVEMARANQDVGEEARYLSNLAWVHNRRGFLAQAATEYEALLPMVEKDRQPYQYAITIGNYAFCLISLGDFDRALALHNEALALFTAQGKEAERATELAALGSLYLRIGDAGRALEILRAAAATQESVANRIGQAASLRMGANAASSLGRHDEALAMLRKSIEIEANPVNIARTRVLISAELRAVGDLNGAEAELTEALKSGSAVVHANALEERARLRTARHDSKAAIADLRAADREYTALGFDFNRIEVNTSLSRALLAAKDVRGASAAADEAVFITGRIRAKSANPEWRALFLSSRYAPYEARIAADLAAGGPDAAWRGFLTAEMVRARSLADQLALGPGRDPEDAAMDGLRAKLTALQLRLETRAQKQGPDDPGAIELRRAIEETSAQIDVKRHAVAARESTLPDSLVELQKALPRDSAVLAYFVGDHESHAWLLTRNEFRHRQLAGATALKTAVEAAVVAQRGNSDSRLAVRTLGTLLLGDLLENIAVARVLVIPDGPLNGVPFAALPAERNSSDMLVDRFVLGYAPSLSLAMQAPRRTPSQHARVAVVSDPVYAADDRRLQLASNADTTLRGPRERLPTNFARLAYSSLEARAVVKAMGSKQTIELSGFSATPARVLALPSNDLGVLHFATHASARRDSPEQSALFLSEYAADGAPVTDSRITAGEIARSGLRADVVVLSGCATGDGSELRGEGVLGLTYGFLANGSHAVVASLWPIEDASTARFMSEFYSAYRTAARPAEALRTAQLRTRGSAATAVWSSFVVRANGFP